MIRELVPEPHEQHVDLFWARVLPYLSLCSRGETVRYRLLLRNNLERRARFGR